MQVMIEGLTSIAGKIRQTDYLDIAPKYQPPNE